MEVSPISANVQMRSKQRPTINSVRSPVLQRFANFVNGLVYTWNLAARFAAGQSAGFTPLTLNGTQILSAAAARSSINWPGIDRQSLATGGAEVWISSIPTNVGSFEMWVPNSGPWTIVTSRADIGARFGLPACTAATGNTTFSVNGQPSDADLAVQIRIHENRHAADHRRVFNTVLVPWDNAMTRVGTQKFRGADVAAAKATLFQAIGGTPDAIARNLYDSWDAATKAFHSTAAGRPGRLFNRTANTDCSQSSVDASAP